MAAGLRELGRSLLTPSMPWQPVAIVVCRSLPVGPIHPEPSAGRCGSMTLDVLDSADFLPTMTQ